MSDEPASQFDFRLPDLSHLDHANQFNAIVSAHTGSVPPSGYRVGHGLYRNVARLTDVALREYAAARSDLADFMQQGSSGKFGPYLRAVDRLEIVITATDRALSYAAALRKRGHGNQGNPVPKKTRTALREMRGVVEHTDDHLTGGGKRGRRVIADGERMMLSLRATEARLGSCRLPYATLADAIVWLARVIDDNRNPA